MSFQLEEGKERGRGLCPLEADLARVREEIRDTVEYCNEAKAKWGDFDILK